MSESIELFRHDRFDVPWWATNIIGHSGVRLTESLLWYSASRTGGPRCLVAWALSGRRTM